MDRQVGPVGPSGPRARNPAILEQEADRGLVFQIQPLILDRWIAQGIQLKP